MARDDFDGLDAIPDTARDGVPFHPSAFPRRLTADTLNSLRRRRTGAGRAVRKPLRRPQREQDHGSGSGSDESDDDDDDDDDVTCFEVFCCCWGPRCCVGSCMLIMTLMGWSAAITYGILRQPSYDDLVVPIRLAKQRWFNAKPTNAEDGFILFDRNADGKISVADMATVARITTGEDPTHEQLAAYIARGDTDGDGTLDEEEYKALLFRERAEKSGGTG